MTCDECRWKTERKECPWNYDYNETDYAEDCIDFRNVHFPETAFIMPDLRKTIESIQEWITNPFADDFPLGIMQNVLDLLREQEAREMSIAEWYKWKKDKHRDPICMLWEDDDTPFWIMDPNKVHEPALLMGRLKLFTHKPTREQCKAVKWDYIWKEEEEK